VARESVHAGPEQKVRARLLRDAEQLIDITLAIPDVHTTFRLLKKRCRLLHVLQPAIAFLLLNGHTGRIDLLLQGVTALNSSRVQNLTAVSPKGSPSVVTARLECIRMPQTV